MLSSDKSVFDKCREGVLALADSAINGVIEKYRSQGLYCLCLTSEKAVRVTDSLHWAEVYRKLWLKDEEWRLVRDWPRELLRKWKDVLRRSGSQGLIKR